MLLVRISEDKSNKCRLSTSNWQLAGLSTQAYCVSQSNTYVQWSSDENVGWPIPDTTKQLHPAKLFYRLYSNGQQAVANNPYKNRMIHSNEQHL